MKIWDLTEIVLQTGVLHKELTHFLDEYIKGSELHGEVYLRTLKRMEEGRTYPRMVVDFYRHCYDSAKTVVELNKVR